MAMTVPQYERQQVQRASQPVGVEAARSGIGQLAQGLQAVGGMFDQMQADVDEAEAKRADTEYSDRVRKTLYEDQTGYLYAQGGDALSRQQSAAETLQKDYDQILGALTPAQREMAQASMESRRQSSLTNVDKHVSGERVTYLNGAAEARLKSAVDDAIIDPGVMDRSLAVARNEIAETGARLGWAPEVIAQKKLDAEGTIHAGVVGRLANVDPQQALGYLNAHRDSMAAGDVARLEGPLIGEAKRRKGRDIGVAAARGAPGAGGIGPDYYASIRAAESGGNDAAKNPTSSATGRYQFIGSTWEGLRKRRPDLGLTANGRLDPVQQERAIRAFTEENANALVRAGVAVTNGTLYAAHFLGAAGAAKVLRGGMTQSVADLVGPGVMAANKFLHGKTVSDFIAWAERKGGGKGTPQASPDSPASAPSGIGSILAIEDADVRTAALQEYQLWSGQAAAAQKAQQDAAQQAGFALIETGGDVDALTLDQKMSIGQSGMSSLREYQSKVNSGQPIETDPALFVELTREAAADPVAFAARDPMEWTGQLTKTDWQAFVKKQSEAVAKPDAEKAVTISTINTVSGDILKGAGIDGKDKSGALKVAKFQEGMLRWAQSYQASNGGNQPTHLEVFERAKAMLLPVVIGDGWLWDTANAPVFELDFDGITPAQVRDRLTIDGKAIEPAAVEAFVTAFEAALGRAPTPAEVVEGLAGGG